MKRSIYFPAGMDHQKCRDKGWFVKKLSSLILFPLFLSLTIRGYPAGEKEISVDEFKWMAETSGNIIGKLKEYNSLLDEYQPCFFLDYDTLLTPGYEYTVTTPAGDWKVGPVEGNAGFYAGTKRIGILGVVNGVNLLIDERYKTGEYSELTGWANYYYILGLRLAYSRDFQALAGYIMKQTPYIIRDYDGKNKFAAYYDSDNRLQTNDNAIENIYMLKLFGIGMGTVYNYDNKKPGSFLLDRDLFASGRYGTFNLSLAYYDSECTYQAGYRYRGLRVFDFLSLGSGGLFNVRSDNEERGRVAHLSVFDTLFLFKDQKSAESAGEVKNDERGRDFYLAVKTGVSLTRDLFDENLYGFFAEISLENIPFLGTSGNLAGGAAYNYEETLRRLPVKNRYIIFLKARILF